MPSSVRRILDSDGIDRALSSIAEAIVAGRVPGSSLALVGIRTRGVPLAQRIAALIRERGLECPVGALDITLYRDDFTTVGHQPILRRTEIGFPVTDVDVVLVDDVLYTGRTVRAALDGVIDFGRPRRIQLAVLVDRGHRELPIRADFVGATVATQPEEIVQVHLREIDGTDGVDLGELAARDDSAGRDSGSGGSR